MSRNFMPGRCGPGQSGTNDGRQSVASCLQLNTRLPLRKAVSPHSGSSAHVSDLFGGGKWTPRRKSPSPIRSPRASAEAARMDTALSSHKTLPFGKPNAPRPGVKELLQNDAILRSPRDASPEGLAPTLDGAWTCKRPEPGRNASTAVGSLLRQSAHASVSDTTLPSGRTSPRRDSYCTLLASKTQSSASLKGVLYDSGQAQQDPGTRCARGPSCTAEHVLAERRDRSPFASKVKGRRVASVNSSHGVGSLLIGDTDTIKEHPELYLPDHGYVGPSQRRRLDEQRGAGVGAPEDAQLPQSSVARSCKDVCQLRAQAEIFQLRDMNMTRSGSLASGGGMGPYGSMSRSQSGLPTTSFDTSRQHLLQDCRNKFASAVASLMRSADSDAY
eukprot:TRINITY_DN92471_c0_g1_i1.p1 TRINITY_DN92471_c0_g1~~TRINITY_DN92471_c0_g1_i1.p1  ORF type:complete len:387 (-),score=20.71 TRINITY_DN92471_c0_g1_i1:27-1187(-)